MDTRKDQAHKKREDFGANAKRTEPNVGICTIDAQAVALLLSRQQDQVPFSSHLC